MAQIFLRRAEGDVVAVRVHGVELPGGGVLGLIVDHWRPGRRAVARNGRYRSRTWFWPIARYTRLN